MKYMPVIGLEVHVELATKSKMFCGCPAEHFGVASNTHTCPVCLGLPGALPVPNKRAVEWTIMLGLALNCKINRESWFDRKNYFYPDLPKGYQISQHFAPFCVEGRLDGIRIHDIHLEEDTGKLQHAEIDNEKVSLVDFNRSGVPLVEIVTEPDFRSIEEVDIYLKKLQRIIRYLGISGADMEKGSMRLEPSISISAESDKIQRPLKTVWKLPEYRVELKNINSFRFARKALEYEIKRQTDLLERGEEIKQQTRGWSEAKSVTVPQREKEEAHDYRYFPEPDIPPMRFTRNQISKIKDQIPELPEAKIVRFMNSYGLDEYNAGRLTETKEMADYYEECIKGRTGEAARTVANWIVNRKVDINKLDPVQLVVQIREAKKSVTIDEKETGKIMEKVLAENPKAVADYRKGKKAAMGFLLGKIAQLTKGPIDDRTKTFLERRLNG